MQSALKTLTFNFVLLLIGLIAIELVWGNWRGGDKMNRLNLLRNYEAHFPIGNLYKPHGKIVHYKRDNFGLRGTYKKLSEIDIVTLGGSTTDQRYISEEETWQAVLAKNLASSGKEIVVVNAGIDGQSTIGHIRNFEWWFPELPGFKTKYFLAYIGVNDLFASRESQYDAMDPNQNSNSIANTIKTNSAVYYLGKTLLGMFLAKYVYKVGHTAMDFSKVQWTTEGLQSDYGKITSETITAYEKRLRMLASKISGTGAKAIFVTQSRCDYRVEGGKVFGSALPSSFAGYTVNGVDYFSILRRVNDTTIRICKEVGGICLDLAGEVSFEQSDYYDFVHNTPAGAKKIGTYLSKKLSTSF